MAHSWHRLTDCEQSRIAYLGRALAADVPVTLAIVSLVGWITQIPLPDFEGYPITRVLLAMCVFAPIGETLLMALLFWLLRFVVKRDALLAPISALIWAAAHSIASPWWGVQIAWSFYIFSLCYVTWQQRSIWQAIAMTTVLHSLHNAVPAIFLIISRANSN